MDGYSVQRFEFFNVSDTLNCNICKNRIVSRGLRHCHNRMITFQLSDCKNNIHNNANIEQHSTIEVKQNLVKSI